MKAGNVSGAGPARDDHHGQCHHGCGDTQPDRDRTAEHAPPRNLGGPRRGRRAGDDLSRGARDGHEGDHQTHEPASDPQSDAPIDAQATGIGRDDDGDRHVDAGRSAVDALEAVQHDQQHQQLRQRSAQQRQQVARLARGQDDHGEGCQCSAGRPTCASAAGIGAVQLASNHASPRPRRSSRRSRPRSSNPTCRAPRQHGDGHAGRRCRQPSRTRASARPTGSAAHFGNSSVSRQRGRDALDGPSGRGRLVGDLDGRRRRPTAAIIRAPRRRRSSSAHRHRPASSSRSAAIGFERTIHRCGDELCRSWTTRVPLTQRRWPVHRSFAVAVAPWPNAVQFVGAEARPFAVGRTAPVSVHVDAAPGPMGSGATTSRIDRHPMAALPPHQAWMRRPCAHAPRGARRCHVVGIVAAACSTPFAVQPLATTGRTVDDSYVHGAACRPRSARRRVTGPRRCDAARSHAPSELVPAATVRQSSTRSHRPPVRPATTVTETSARQAGDDVGDRPRARASAVTPGAQPTGRIRPTAVAGVRGTRSTTSPSGRAASRRPTTITRWASAGDGDCRDVIGNDVRPAAQHRDGAGPDRPAHTSASGGAEPHIGMCACCRQQLDHVASDGVRDVDSLDRASGGGGGIDRAHLTHVGQQRATPAAGEHLDLVGERRSTRCDDSGEAVERPFAETMGAQDLDRVLRRHEHERIGQLDA